MLPEKTLQFQAVARGLPKDVPKEQRTFELNGETKNLSLREYQILLLLREGITGSKEIAYLMGKAFNQNLSDSTIKNETSQMTQKLGLSTMDQGKLRIEAILLGVKLGLLEGFQPPKSMIRHKKRVYPISLKPLFYFREGHKLF